MLLWDSFISCLDSLLGYSTGELQALQLIVLVVFGAVGCRLYVGQLLANLVGNDSGFIYKFDIMENNLFIFLCVYIYIFMPHSMIIFYFRLHYFHDSKVYFYTTLKYYHFT